MELIHITEQTLLYLLFKTVSQLKTKNRYGLSKNLTYLKSLR